MREGLPYGVSRLGEHLDDRGRQDALGLVLQPGLNRLAKLDVVHQRIPFGVSRVYFLHAVK